MNVPTATTTISAGNLGIARPAPAEGQAEAHKMSWLSTLAELAALSPLCAAIFATWPGAHVTRVIDDPSPEIPPQPASASVRDLPVHLSWFRLAIPKEQGPALGVPRDTTWGKFCDALQRRREGEKNGPNIVPARFKPQSDGKVCRRGVNLISRTAVAIDVETNRQTGQAPPDFTATVRWLQETGWAGVVYTSHNHSLFETRYRLILPLAEEIDPELPVMELLAGHLLLHDVYDPGKRNAASVFYLPSCPPGRLSLHEVAVIDGKPIDAGWVRCVAGEMLADRKAEQARIADEARAQAEARRQAKIAAGYDPDDSLIEKIRDRLDLEHLLLTHGYDKSGCNYRHPNSMSGSFGANIKAVAGIERVYSHNAGDPLHRDNLPAWCGVTALDAFDVVAILDYGGDRTKALRDMAERYLGNNARERKAVAALIHRLRDAGASQACIEAAALAKGASIGLSRAVVIDVAHHVVTKITAREAAYHGG